MRIRRSSCLLLPLLLVAAACLVAFPPSDAEARLIRVDALSGRGDDGQTVQAQVQQRAEVRRRLLQIREDLGDADTGRLVHRQASLYRVVGDVLRELRILRDLWPRIDLPEERERRP